jgi:hypothetical protein
MTTPLSPALLAQLAAPFPLEQIEVKPGSVRQDGTAALALAYADWRVYAERLDSVIGPANWQIQLVPWGQTRVIARLTICGITKDATGEGDPDGPNCGTIAEAQAKKRACAEFGLGRYLYLLPKVWGSGQGDRKNFRFDDPGELAFKMYAARGLLSPSISNDRQVPPEAEAPGRERPTIPAHNGNGHIAPDPARLAAARQALATAERRISAPAQNAPPATDKQRRAICALLVRCAEHGVGPDAVDRLGETQRIAHLSSLRRASNLPASFTKAAASTLIGELDRLLKEAQA